MSDLIDKQAAIDADAIPWTNLNDNPNSKIKVLITFAEKVNRMPTIKPKKGRWLQNKDDSAGCGYFICSECKKDFYDAWNFCPNCGTDMRGEEDGEKCV